MRIVSWNMRHVTRSSDAAWQYLRELAPDLALLQEVNSFPETLQSEYQILYRKVRGKTGRLQSFGTAVVVRGQVTEPIKLSSEWDWVDKELVRFEGSLVATTVNLGLSAELQVMSVHSPTWPVDRSRLSGVDVSQVKLKENPDVWGTELIWAALRSQDLNAAQWIVGGDFNSSETFDYLWPAGRVETGNSRIVCKIWDSLNAFGTRRADWCQHLGIRVTEGVSTNWITCLLMEISLPV
jgi:hypothetical protein